MHINCELRTLLFRTRSSYSCSLRTDIVTSDVGNLSSEIMHFDLGTIRSEIMTSDVLLLCVLKVL